MDIRMDESRNLVLTPEQFPEKRQGQSHGSATVILIEHKGMRHTTLADHAFKHLSGTPASYDIPESHLSLMAVKPAISER